MDLVGNWPPIFSRMRTYENMWGTYDRITKHTSVNLYLFTICQYKFLTILLVYAKDATQTKSSRSVVNIILVSGNFNEGRKYSIFQNLFTSRPKLHQKSRLLCVHNASGRPRHWRGLKTKPEEFNPSLSVCKVQRSCTAWRFKQKPQANHLVSFPGFRIAA